MSEQPSEQPQPKTYYAELAESYREHLEGLAGVTPPAGHEDTAQRVRDEYQQLAEKYEALDQICRAYMARNAEGAELLAKEHKIPPHELVEARQRAQRGGQL